MFAAAFGGTRPQASGPTGPMTIVAATIVAVAIERTGSLEAGLGVILLSFLLGGIIQIALGLLRIGKYVRYFPYPVVSGFMSGVGLIIVVLQIWPFLGSSSPKSTIEVFTRIGEPLSQLNWAAVGLGTLTLVTYYVFPKLTKRIPAVLAALVVGTVAGVFAMSQGVVVPIIGDIPSGLPTLRVSEFFGVAPEHARFIIESGITIALLGSIDSLLTAVISDSLTGERHDSNRELIGQGIGNMISAAFGGIPGAGATKNTVVNIKAGGTSRLSGMTQGAFQLVVLLGAGSIASQIPLSVLAGLLISVGLAIVDKKSLKHFGAVPSGDSVVMLVVLMWTVFGNLVEAVAVGIVLSSLLFMKKMGDMAEQESKVFSPAETEHEESRFGAGNVLVQHLSGPLFFGSSHGLVARVSEISGEVDVLLVRMDEVPYIDQSGLYALEETLTDLRDRGVTVTLISPQKELRTQLERLELIPTLVPPEQIFDSVESCEAWLEERADQGSSKKAA
ncbi:MAG: SulP family inorganic anion transporter [Myxococcota bacterium]